MTVTFHPLGGTICFASLAEKRQITVVELKLKLGFTVKATENSAGGSFVDLRKGVKGSLTLLNKVEK